MNIAVQNTRSSDESVLGWSFGSSLWENILSLIEYIFWGIFILWVVFALMWFVFVLVRAILIARGQWSTSAVVYLEEIWKDFRNMFKSIFSCLYSSTKKLGWAIENWKWTILILCIIFLAPLILNYFGAIKIIHVKTGQVGINIENGKILESWYHLTLPILDAYVISQVSEYTFDIKSITWESSELQDVIIDVNLSFRMEEQGLSDFYRKNGIKSIWETANDTITPKAIETIKEVVRQYSFKEVQKKTMEIKSGSLIALKNAFKNTGISIDEINIINIAISSQYAELEKEQLTTQNALEIAKREADIQTLRAEWIRKSNEIIWSQKITPEMLEEKRLDIIDKFIDKWNGTPPGSIGGAFLPIR